MKVSIIIPVYNVSDYVERCLYSVIAQTYSDLECIIVDDCTPDDSIEKCERIIAEYSGPIIFTILHHNHNRGLSAARNTGTKAANGKWIFYLDSDDEISPDAISLMMHEVCNNVTLEMVVGNVKSIPHDDYYDLKTTILQSIIINDNNAARLSLLHSNPQMPVMAWNKLIKADFLINNKLSFKEGIFHEDEHWIFFVIKKLKSVSFIDDRTYIHYETPNSIMSTSSQIKRADCFIDIIYDFLKHLDSPFSDLQLLKSLTLYFLFFNSVNKKKSLRKVRFLFAYQLIIHHFHKIAFHFILHNYRNRSVQALKYRLLPDSIGKLSQKYYDAISNEQLTTKTVF